MSGFIYIAAICGLSFHVCRLLDIAWPTKFLPWPYYAIVALIWLGVAAVFHP